LSYLCAGYKRFFGHADPVMREMAALVRAGREAGEATATVRARDSGRGRNDACPCGSGRKWKRCHGAPARGHATIGAS
jgi:uncharacterized protein